MRDFIKIGSLAWAVDDRHHSNHYFGLRGSQNGFPRKSRHLIIFCIVSQCEKVNIIIVIVFIYNTVIKK